MSQHILKTNTPLFGNAAPRQDRAFVPLFGGASTAPAFGGNSVPVSNPFGSSSSQNTPTVPVENANTQTNEVLPEVVYDFIDRTGNNRKYKIISHDNLLTLASDFYKATEHKEADIVDTLKAMICSSQYLFSERFKKEKMDLNDIQFKFRMLTQPESIARGELISKLFKIDLNTVI